jgi:hypothetical protein
MSPKACLLATLALVSSVAIAAETKFVSRPVLTRTNGKAKLTFAVSGPTDVEIAILDASGRIVRHLAAGVLGGKTPPPAPLKAGLKQEIEWDLRTDTGKPATGGPFNIRVRLGMGVKLDGFIGENRYYVSALRGMATDPQGNVYVYSASTGSAGGARGAAYLQVFNRKGEYQRTLLPTPANLPKEKVKAFKMVPAPGKHLFPRNRDGVWPVLCSAPGGKMASRVGKDGILYFAAGNALGRLGPDGGSIGDWISRAFWTKGNRPPRTLYKWHMVRSPFATISPDGKYAYITGIYQKNAYPKGTPIKYPRGRVYRMELSGGGIEKFADIKGARSTGASAFDKDGNLLVCDTGGNRVVVLDPEGNQVGELKVKSPRHLACHRKTGALYVMGVAKTGYNQAYKSLARFDGWKNGGKEVWRLDFRKAGYGAVFSLDDSSSTPVLWAGVSRSAGASGAWQIDKPAQIFRLEDRGDKCVETPHGITAEKTHASVVTRMAVHPENDLVVSRAEFSAAAGYDGLSGKRIKLPFKDATDMGVGLDGNWYINVTRSFVGPILKFDKDLKPLPLLGRSGNGKGPANTAGFAYGRWGAGFGTAGITADPTGRVYSLQMINIHVYVPTAVVVFGPDGKAENHKYLKDNPAMTKKHKYFSSVLFSGTHPDGCIAGGIGLDWKGNIYVGLRGRPPGYKPPAGFEKDPAYEAVVGSVVKVKPEGGRVYLLGGKGSRPPKAQKQPPADINGLRLHHQGTFPCAGGMFVQNATKIYPGLGSMSRSFGSACYCRQPMFQVDGWGRIYIPNAITFSVQVVDNEGNQILKFGHYGNADSRGSGEKSPIKTPEIPLGWPLAVGASYKAVYVADTLNRRIVRLKKTYQAEQIVEVK